MKDKVSDGKVVVKICNGRLCLPSGYKVSNGDEFILTRNVFAPSCLALYTRKQWIPIRELLFKKGFLKPREWQALTRYVLGNAEDCIVKARAIRISSHLIKAVDLPSEAIWIQRANRVEIWNPRAFDELVFPVLLARGQHRFAVLT